MFFLTNSRQKKTESKNSRQKKGEFFFAYEKARELNRVEKDHDVIPNFLIGTILKVHIFIKRFCSLKAS